MSNEPEKRETTSGHVFGDGEAMSLAEALLAMDSPTVQQLDAAIPNDPRDRRESRAIEDVVAESVFGRPEPAVAIASRRPLVAAGGTGSSIRPVAISYPSTTARNGSKHVAAPLGSRRTPVGQRVTVALTVLFVTALSGSVLLTILGRESDASLETTTEPTVGGVTTLATVPAPPTTPAPPVTATTTTAAPSTTGSSTTLSTAAASSSSVITAPATTALSTTTTPTTARPATTRQPTTRQPTTRPPTTRPPTTAPPTTQITLPDITFAPPTWQGTGDP